MPSPWDEIPDQDVPILLFVGEDVACSLRFVTDWVCTYPRRTHINIGELQATLAILPLVAGRERSVRVSVITDSHVAGVCMS